MHYGKAESTINLNDCGNWFCNAYRNKRGLCTLQDSTPEEFEADNLESFFYDLCYFASSTPIPLGFNNDFEPKNPEQKRLVMHTTLAKYIGQGMVTIRHYHPQHADFEGLKSDEYPVWYTSLLGQFKPACINYHLKLQHQHHEEVTVGCCWGTVVGWSAVVGRLVLECRQWLDD